MGLRLLVPSKKVVAFNPLSWYNLRRWFSLRTVAFRGQRFSFLGSKNHFLRDLQLGLRLLVPPKTLLLFPQDKEGFGSITSHEENWFLFSRSRLPFAPINCH